LEDMTVFWSTRGR